MSVKTQRGEFETTEQFNARTQQMAGKKVIVQLALNGPSSGGWVNYSYDADKQKFVLRPTTLTVNKSIFFDDPVALRLDTSCFSSKQSARESVGQNAFGARTTITVETIERWCLAYTNLQSRVASDPQPRNDCAVAGIQYGFGTLSATFEIAPVSLQALLPFLRYRLTGTLARTKVPNMIAMSGGTKNATTNAPLQTDRLNYYLPMQLDKLELVDVRTNTVMATREPCIGQE